MSVWCSDELAKFEDPKIHDRTWMSCRGVGTRIGTRIGVLMVTASIVGDEYSSKMFA